MAAITFFLISLGK